MPAKHLPWNVSLRLPPKSCLSPPTLEPKGSTVTQPLAARFEADIAAAADLAVFNPARA
jgi:hypothetical protein